MDKEKLNQLLNLSKFISEKLNQRNIENKKFKEEMLEIINFEENLKNLPKEWFKYRRKNSLDGDTEFNIETILSDLMKNYEKLKSRNFLN